MPLRPFPLGKEDFGDFLECGDGSALNSRRCLRSFVVYKGSFTRCTEQKHFYSKSPRKFFSADTFFFFYDFGFAIL